LFLFCNFFLDELQAFCQYAIKIVDEAYFKRRRRRQTIALRGLPIF